MKRTTVRWAWAIGILLAWLPCVGGLYAHERGGSTESSPAGAGRALSPVGEASARSGVLSNLSTITDEAGMASPLGGDDVLIATVPVSSPLKPQLQVAADGTLYVAFDNNSTPRGVDVYRSTDGGSTWTLWSQFAPSGFSGFGDFVIAEGNLDRAFIAYQNFFPAELRIAYADLAAGVPTWTPVTLLATTFTTDNVSIETDAWGFSAYFVYVAFEANDGNGKDIYFARSTTQGTSFAAAYRIAETTDGSWGYHDPIVSVGAGTYVHVAYMSDLSPRNIHHRRAANYANGAWDAPQLLDSDSILDLNAFAASRTDGAVVLHQHASPTGLRRYSTDYGVNWSSTSVFNNRRALRDGIAFLPDKFVAATGSDLGISGQWHVSLLRSNSATPGSIDLIEDIAAHTTEFSAQLGGGIVVDPTHASRIAIAWERTAETSVKEVRFDAEWRRDAGYPNTEVGFPVAVSGGAQTPPAVAEVDGDAEMEIVFGTIAGDIYVVNHDGTNAPGWPVDIGTLPYDAPVAVGDLVGNGDFSVVAGNTAGSVYAFDALGDPLPGWPVNLGTGAPVYVSIGALGPPHLHYVVALSGQKLTILNYQGETMGPGFALLPLSTYTRPAAIGDVNNDGVAEIVSAAGPNLFFHRLDGVLPGISFPGLEFSDAPTLADIENDGDLEIVVPTTNGRLVLWDFDTGSLPSSPMIVSPGVALTSAAMANILGTGDLELSFAQADGPVHVRYLNGTEQAGYPQSAASPVYMPPILYPVNISGSNVNIGSVASIAHSWRNIPATVVPGWPRNLPGRVEETFAAGDIDGDNRSEIVVLGVNYLTVFDVGTAPPTNPRAFWPMYGHDAQRTGCMCEEIVSSADDAPAATYRTSLAAFPNPFNPETTIGYEIAQSGPVSLAIYDVAGRKVLDLINGEHRVAGHHTVPLRTSLPSGVYFARLVSGGREASTKLVVLK